MSTFKSVGFLMPTLLNVDIGPLSYMGYVNSLTVNHTYFTQDMIPLRTELTISLNVLATAGITTQTALDSFGKPPATTSPTTTPSTTDQYQPLQPKTAPTPPPAP